MTWLFKWIFGCFWFYKNNNKHQLDWTFKKLLTGTEFSVWLCPGLCEVYRGRRGHVIQRICSWFHVPCPRLCRDFSFSCLPVSPGSVDVRNVKRGSWQSAGIAVVTHCCSEGGRPGSVLSCPFFVTDLWWDQCEVERMCLETCMVSWQSHFKSIQSNKNFGLQFCILCILVF